MKSCTCIAPVNIAVIKYWGKRDEQLILPVNSSVSVTLGMNELQAKTTVAVSDKFETDRIWLNGKEESVNNKRIQNVLKDIRRRAGQENGQGAGDGKQLCIHVCSENNFPTAAGLASSAAGYACLVYTLAQLYEVKGELSGIARQGSGSACRSMFGGFVLWEMGQRADGSDSLARQLAPAEHWPSLRVLILVVSDQKKQVGSTEGMQTTVDTSELMKRRVEVVPQHTEEMIKAIQGHDFPTFARITMQESNQFHAVCLDTYPPVFYLTDSSRLIIQMIHAYNVFRNQTRVAYTFDAGPNACLYLMEEDVPVIIALVKHFFPPQADSNQSFIQGIDVTPTELSTTGILESVKIPTSQGEIKYIIHTKVGSGPQELKDPKDSLLNSDGFPKHTS